MKIGYALITRNRPAAFIGTMMTAWKLRSGVHDLRMACAIDTDDPEVVGAANFLKKEFPLFVSCEAPPLSIGSKWNRLTAAMNDCDAICLMTERMIPITPGWDDLVADALNNIPDRPFYWTAPLDPGFAAPVVPRKWLDACDNLPLPEYFPFWFTDTWLSEVQALVFGFPHAFIKAAYAGERRATMACRDVEFWVEYYTWLAPMRRAAAQIISHKMGYEWREPSVAVRDKIAYRTNYLKSHAAELQSQYGDSSPPSDRYLAALARAKGHMNESRRQVA